MLFSDKLVFLMELTGTNNLELAEAIDASPTQISLMRTGRRGQPQKADRLKRMSDYFALKSTTDYHRAALADMIGQQKIKLMLEAPDLALAVYYWLSGASELPGNRAEQFLQEMNSFDFQTANDLDIPQTPPFENERRRGSRNYVYCGNEGRRTAVHEFVRYLQSLEAPCDVVVSSDESFEWLLEAPSFARKLSAQMLALVERGFSCRRIAPPLLTADEAFDSLSRWLPLYLTRQIQSYYYPRLHDDLYRSTIYAVPGKMAVASISIGPQTEIDATLLVTDQSLVELLTRRFEAYCARCVPMTTAYGMTEEHPDLPGGLLQFESCHGNYIRRTHSLSAITTPPEIQKRIFSAGDEHTANRRETFLKAITLFESNLAEHRCIDIIKLADTASIIAGKEPIALSYSFNKEPLFYTVREYILHLRYLLKLLKQWDNYTVVLDEAHTDVNAIYVKERQSAILIRTNPPFTVFEISEPNTVAACQDYLHRIAGETPKSPAQKQRVVFEIREAISRLEQYL